MPCYPVHFGSITGRYSMGHAADTGMDIVGLMYEDMSPEWQKEHEKAFELASSEAQGHFKHCPKCHRYVCDND